MTIVKAGFYYTGECSSCLAVIQAPPNEVFLSDQLPNISEEKIKPRELPAEGRIRCPNCSGIIEVSRRSR